MSFRSVQFDPLMVALQIVAVQTSYYTTLSLLVIGLELLTGVPITLSRLFSPQEINYSTVFGWGLCTVFLLSSAITYL
jgi:hypothetical protein